MAIAPVGSATSTNTNTAALAAATTTTSATTPTQSLGINDFLKLLAVQMQNQDPLNPTSDTEFISQMASFTSLQQMSSLNTSMTSYISEQQPVDAQSYLGKQVTLTDTTGATVTSIQTPAAAQ
jgi:flagellar basal-body rod modification protein FlgD